MYRYMSNDNYDTYLSILKRSTVSSSVSSSMSGKSAELIGGADQQSKSKPFGGFPPIHLCSQTTELDIESKNREYSTHKGSVSIKDIMSKRRGIVPLIS